MDTYLLLYMDSRYKLVGSIKCLRCGRQSQEYYDIKYLYCRGCQHYHTEPQGLTTFIRSTYDYEESAGAL